MRALTIWGDGLIVADTREQVATLNAAIRDHRHTARLTGELTTGLTGRLTGEPETLTTVAGELVGVGDRIATRRNDRSLDVANRDTWTVTAADPDEGLTVTGRTGGAVPARGCTRAG